MSSTSKKYCTICGDYVGTKMCAGCQFVVCPQHSVSHLNYTKCCTCNKMGCQLTMHGSQCTSCYNKGVTKNVISKCCDCGKKDINSNFINNYCSGCFKKSFKYHYEPQKCCTCRKMTYELANNYCSDCYKK